MPKVGKTTLATRFPKHLLLGFEKGYNALPGVKAMPINSWSEFIQVLSQLKADKMRKVNAEKKGEEYETTYETIIIDIADIAWDYCESYVLAQHGVKQIKDIPFGQGWKLVGNEFDKRLRSIVQDDYGLILISHAKIKQSEIDENVKYATCTLDARPKSVCERLVDVYGYISVDESEEGLDHILHLRGCPEWEAGARFKYIQESIKLNYDNLVDAIGDAIDKEAQEFGAEGSDLFVDKKLNNYAVKEEVDFNELKKSVDNKISGIMEKAKANNTVQEDVQDITTIIEKYLGDTKLAEITPNQKEQLILIGDEINKLADK